MAEATVPAGGSQSRSQSGFVASDIIIAGVVTCVAERGGVAASTEQLLAWAAEHLDVDGLWESFIGPAVDTAEAQARATFGSA